MRRRRLVPAAALAAALVASPPAARAATLANVYVDGTFRGPVASEGLSETAVYDYKIRARPGEEAGAHPHSGWTVHDIIGAAGASGAAAADLLGRFGWWFTLSGHELDQPTDAFADGLVPIVWLNGVDTGSMRPLKADPSDTNADTDIQGAPVAIYVHTRGRLDSLSAGAETSRPKPGEDVQFSAVASACSGGAAPPISWNFGDGTSGTGARPTHSYAAAGSYYGTADAECGDGTGAAVSIEVSIVGAGGGPDPGPGGTATPGPVVTATPTPTRTSRPRASATATPKPRGRNDGGRRDGSWDGNPRATATATPGSAPTAAPTSAPTAAPTAAPTSAPTAGPTGAPAPSAAPTATATPAAPRESDLPVVRGRLVSAVVRVPPEEFATLQATEQPAGSGGERPDAPPRIALPVGLLVLAALLSFGAWRERRSQ